MAEQKCGLRYCKATVADYTQMAKPCCCLKCFGEKCDTCDMYKNMLKTGTNLQREMCMKCALYNGR